jgi:hypothetical protein
MWTLISTVSLRGSHVNYEPRLRKESLGYVLNRVRRYAESLESREPSGGLGARREVG